MPIKIYLADLSHVGSGLANETFPLNIGLVASYARKTFDREIEVTLFKYPLDLLETLRQSSPDILGCSNYSWNNRLSSYFAKIAKLLNPKTLTVFGGTNYPFDPGNQELFLRARPELNLHTFYEGELAFVNVVDRVLSSSNSEKVLKDPIPGCQFISPSDGSFVFGPNPGRISELSSIPSPYVTGILDKFFDGILTPLVETARGCPFTCNFCNAGDDYFNKTTKFSDEYVQEELNYVAKKAAGVGVGTLTIADNNFGMIPRDATTSKVIHDLQQKYGYPSHISLSTGKNSHERILKATQPLGATAPILLAFQSFNKTVLKNIKRDNIRLEDLRAISDELNTDGRPQYSEIIMPLPGETKESIIGCIDEIVNSNSIPLSCHTIVMLHGTPYKDDAKFLKQHEYKTKFRMAVQSYSKIENDYSFDVEEVGVATKDFSFNDYLEVRKYLFLVELCCNSKVFHPLNRYLSQNEFKISQLLKKIFESLDALPPSLKTVFGSFVQETTDELWDSEQSFVAYYSDKKNYRMLESGERGGNVMFRHRIWVSSKFSEIWISFVFQSVYELLKNILDSDRYSSVKNELEALQCFMVGTTYKSYSLDGLDAMLTKQFDYDILAWMQGTKTCILRNFAINKPITYKFYFNANEKRNRLDGFKRYGTSVSGLTKQLQRRMMPPRSVAIKEHENIK